MEVDTTKFQERENIGSGHLQIPRMWEYWKWTPINSKNVGIFEVDAIKFKEHEKFGSGHHKIIRTGKYWKWTTSNYKNVGILEMGCNKFQERGNTGSRHHQTSGEERKNEKEYPRQTRKLSKPSSGADILSKG